MRPRRYKPSTKIEARPTAKMGRGVFATKPIRKGEELEASPVILVPRNQGDALLGSILGHYMFQTDDNQRYVVALGFASLINHSDDANAEFFVSTESIVVRALRSIRPGTEVTFDYGWTVVEWARAGITQL